MLHINYPENKIEFEQKYIELLKISDSTKIAFETFISAPHFLFPTFTLEYILTASFKELYTKTEFLYMNKKDKEELKKIFYYDDFQSKIKSFFEQNLPTKTCYYCNLDFINSFNDTYDYHDALDFVKKASIDDLKKIKGIEKTAQNIYNQRLSVSSIDNLMGVSLTQKQNLKNIILKKKHSHFTLDHVIDKGTHPLLSLSLYNFVPSCYACNSKFKGKKQFIDSSTVNYLSPTLDEKDFKFDEDVKFRILFKSSNHISYIKSKKDFILDFKYFRNQAEYEKYINIFKLKGRYIFHKDEIVELIEKKKKYSDSKIEEMSKQLKIPIQKIKEDIFGKELFQGNLEDKSMTKFKRDIARQIGIIK